MLGRLGGSDFCLLLEDKMQEEIEVLAQNFVNEVNEVNISWNKEFFIEVRYGWFVKEVGTISSTDAVSYTHLDVYKRQLVYRLYYQMHSRVAKPGRDKR